MNEIPQPVFLEFEGLRLYPEEQFLIRLQDDRRYELRKKVCDFLMALLRKPNEIVSYEELRDQVWPEFKDVEAAKRTMRETKRSLDQLLGDVTNRPKVIIETVSGKGYRLNGTVTSSLEKSTAYLDLKKPGVTSDPLPPLVLPTRQILVASVVYGLMYVDALLLEIAYQWDVYGSKALRLAPIVFGWVTTTSVVALALDWRFTERGRRFGLLFSASLFAVSALLVYLRLLAFLPPDPVTEAVFQASTGQAAYLKNIGFYFLPLAIAFLLIPFHTVSLLSREMQLGNCEEILDAFSHPHRMTSDVGLLISTRLLGLVLLAAGITSLALTYRLFDNLKPSPYLNWFSILAIVRVLLYFGFGAVCLTWYSASLSNIKRRCRSRQTSERVQVAPINDY
jgi:DNA-binding winged helix-turn-helix (wHTH) protein